MENGSFSSYVTRPITMKMKEYSIKLPVLQVSVGNCFIEIENIQRYIHKNF
jgi:hypothetical protein